MDTLPPTMNLYGEILAPGAIVGSYLVDELAFEGGFASIYRAHHMVTSERIALKVLHRALAAAPRMIERFRQEADVIRRMGHPNIVRIFELDEITPGRPYIAMEWLDGRNLRDELKARGPFTPAEALATMVEIGSALSAAHERGVIHRDIKAPNIVALPRGDWFTVKLIDFGIAKLIAAEDQHTALTTHTSIGTPQSMAPEQILRQGVDERTDIYALGILLYQLVCGRAPFASHDLIELEQLHLHATPPRASDIAPVPAAVDEVIFRALAKRKQDRQPSVAAFLDDLGRAVASGATMPVPAARRHRLEMGMGVYVEVEAAMADTDETQNHDANAGADADSNDDRMDRISEAMDDVLERARELMAAAGLTVCLETGNGLLGATALEHGGAAVAHRELIVRAALARYQRWTARQATRDLVRVRITLHLAEVEVEHRTHGEVLAGGPLLQLGQWPRAAEHHGVLATSAVLAGLPPWIHRAIVPGHAELVRVVPAPRAEPPV